MAEKSIQTPEHLHRQFKVECVKRGLHMGAAAEAALQAQVLAWNGYKPEQVLALLSAGCQAAERVKR
jgi:hypothetical protein